ncbi:MAG: glycosyltransferase family 2 protein [Candidatus Moranbacteria bacterium]|nr:glycosyltransferase family 2 protein [Candidatus Moranbacteria bacterium]
MQNSNKLSIIIVNYRSEKYLEKCLSSIYGVWGESLEIIIVNNDVNESLAKIATSFPAVKIIQQGSNVGFGTAHNAGSRLAGGKYLLFLNPDMAVLDSMEKILDKFEEDDTVGIIGARLVKLDGQNQAWSAGYEANILSIIKNKIKLSEREMVWNSAQTKEVDWVSGGAMFIRKEIFDKVSGFDENFFMYFEDMDLCKRVRALGKKVIYFPSVRIEHVEGGSRENKNKQKKSYYASQDYYFSKHFGSTQATLVKLLRKIFV